MADLDLTTVSSRYQSHLSFPDSFQATVPSGASKGDYEAVELRDGDSAAYGGNGVLRIVSTVENILASALTDKNFDVATDLDKIDRRMTKLDSTDSKSRLDANAILGVSMACARAGAAVKVHLTMI